MLVIPLQSGSNGNCVYVEAGRTRLLLDAGISGLKAQRRLEALGRGIRGLDAVIISHDHADHCRCAGIYHRKFHVPVYITAATLEGARRNYSLGKLQEARSFRAGEVLEFGSLRVHTIPTPHDASDAVAFVVDDGRRRLGILTDLGHVFAGLEDMIASLDAVVLESNYDPDMLDSGPYPWFLKQRIKGPGGHLSNDEAARLLSRCRGGRLKWACLAHLSEQNNTPQTALRTHRAILRRRLPISVASRYEAVGPLEV